MFTPIRVAAATAVLALTGTLALVGGPLAPTQPAVVPGAESPVSMDPAHFTGTIIVGDDADTETETLADRTIERWRTNWLNTTTDPRVNGRVEAMDYLETIDGPDGTVILSHSGHGRLVNDEGAFGVECYGAGSAIADAQIFCWHTGEEGYEGLTAFVVLSDFDDRNTWQAQGWIYPDERAPLLDFDE